MRSNSSNKGESVGELAEPLITERSAYKSPDRALVGPTVVQQPRAPPPEARTGSQLDLPTFNGGDVAEWMFLLEFYFWVTKTLDQDKISVVVMKLSGRALQWYLWIVEFFPFTSWADFRDQLLVHYGGTTSCNIYMQFFSLRHERSIREYREEFEALSAFIHNISTPLLENTFLNELKEEIVVKISMFKHTYLRDMMNIVQLVEKRLATQWRA